MFLLPLVACRRVALAARSSPQPISCQEMLHSRGEGTMLTGDKLIALDLGASRELHGSYNIVCE